MAGVEVGRGQFEGSLEQGHPPHILDPRRILEIIFPDQDWKPLDLWLATSP